LKECASNLPLINTKKIVLCFYLSFFVFCTLDFLLLRVLVRADVEGTIAIDHCTRGGNDLLRLDTRGCGCSSNLNLVGLAALSAASRRIPALLLEEDLRAHREREVRLAVRAVDGIGRKLGLGLLCYTAGRATDGCIKSASAEVLLRLGCKDKVLLAVLALNVHGCELLSLPLCAALRAATRLLEALLLIEVLLLIGEEEHHIAVVALKGLAARSLLLLLSTT